MRVKRLLARVMLHERPVKGRGAYVWDDLFLLCCWMDGLGCSPLTLRSLLGAEWSWSTNRLHRTGKADLLS
jgi:hypothetical protein